MANISNLEEKENILLRIAKYLIPWKGDSIVEIIRKIIFIVAAATLIVTVSMMLTSFASKAEDNRNNSELAEIYHGTASTKVEINTDRKIELQKAFPKVQEQFLPLLEKNEDTIGWLTVSKDHPFADYVVVQCEDNNQYLKHDFRGNYSESGTLFVDFRNKITPEGQSANIIIYGHNMATGEYFGQLPYYFNYALSHPDHEDISFYKANPTLTFSTLYKTSTYKIFGGMLVNINDEAGEVFAYHNVHSFANKAEFDDFCAEVLDRSNFINPDVNLKYGDNLLTLSTCMLGSAYGDTELRWVIFAREVREGEDESVDVSKAYANPSPKFYDMYYDYRGGEWEGRGWKEEIIQGYKP